MESRLRDLASFLRSVAHVWSRTMLTPRRAHRLLSEDPRPISPEAMLLVGAAVGALVFGRSFVRLDRLQPAAFLREVASGLVQGVSWQNLLATLLPLFLVPFAAGVLIARWGRRVRPAPTAAPVGSAARDLAWYIVASQYLTLSLALVVFWCVALFADFDPDPSGLELVGLLYPILVIAAVSLVWVVVAPALAVVEWAVRLPSHRPALVRILGALALVGVVHLVLYASLVSAGTLHDAVETVSARAERELRSLDEVPDLQVVPVDRGQTTAVGPDSFETVLVIGVRNPSDASVLLTGEIDLMLPRDYYGEHALSVRVLRWAAGDAPVMEIGAGEAQWLEAAFRTDSASYQAIQYAATEFARDTTMLRFDYVGLGVFSRYDEKYLDWNRRGGYVPVRIQLPSLPSAAPLDSAAGRR